VTLVEFLCPLIVRLLNIICCFEVHERMVCESERWKQNLLMNWVVNTTPTCCVFDDVTTLSDDAKRLCVRHKKACVSWCQFIARDFKNVAIAVSYHINRQH